MLLLVSFYGALRAHVAAVLFLSLYKLVSFPERFLVLSLMYFTKKNKKEDYETKLKMKGGA